jgi:hypothetical protein
VKVPNVLREHSEHASPPLLKQLAGKQPFADPEKIAELSPLLLLMRILAEPEREKWQQFICFRALHWLDARRMAQPDEAQQFKRHAERWPSAFREQFDSAEFVFHCHHNTAAEQCRLSTFIAGEKSAITELDPDALVLACQYHTDNSDREDSRKIWQRLLQMMNLGQFLPRFFITTEKGLQDGDFALLQWGKEVKAEQAPGLTDDAWDEVSKMADAEVRPLLTKLHARQVSVPVAGYEIPAAGGTSLTEAELAWPAQRVAVLLDYQFEDAGLDNSSQQYAGADQGKPWQLFALDTDIDTLVSHL